MLVKLARSLAVLGFAAAVGTVPALAQDVTCADCHDVTVTSPMHEGFSCGDCHADVDLETHPDAPVDLSPAAVCANCHDTADTLQSSVHADVGCTDCHGAAHEILPPSDLASPVSPVNQIQTCGECHDSGMIDAYLESVHARALLKSGLTQAPSCSDCHGAHEILPPDDPESKISWRHVPETCGSCHQLILRDWQTMSAHGVAWEAGDDAAPVCTTCHESHAIQIPTEARERLAFPGECGDCHEQALDTFRDSFHGKASELGFVPAAICSDCHTPHRNLGTEDPRSTIHPDNLAATCGACHGEVTVSFATFDPHADVEDKEDNAVVYWVYFFMTWLLIGVFGFFGLHDILWLQRIVVAGARGEVHRFDYKKDEPWVRRFQKSQIWVHATVIVTFLILAATGLPLRFPFAEWAQTLAGLFGGLEVTRFLHRLAAAGTFGYFLVHVVHLVRRGVVRKEPGLLWGWKSMVPRAKDLRDFVDNLKYFLYVGKAPRLDRWTYWEKFDYFAVFWGVVIIGGSGLALWFPTLFSSFLPGWWLNVAAVIHSDEALLATGFIFVFHFFHTHLRPETFPLDPVIFTGAVPLERFKEERPDEYDRLVKEGRLEEHFVPRPSEAVMRRAYVLGGIAVTIGVALVIGIVWALVTH